MSPFKNYPTFETKIYKKTVKPSAQSKNAIALRNQKNLKHSDSMKNKTGLYSFENAASLILSFFCKQIKNSYHV